MTQRAAAGSMSAAERLGAWAVTGPLGRVAAFALDLGALAKTALRQRGR